MPRPLPASWSDMSNYVVHFTKDGSGHDASKSIMRIYGDQELKPGRAFGIGKDRAPAAVSQEAVCFSEIPPGEWGRIVDRRGTRYGLAFTKEFVIRKGGGPIWYVWKDTRPHRTLKSMMADAHDDPSALLWSITPMIDAPGEYAGGPYEFDWEREWRVVGAMKFEVDDVAFLFIPEDQHADAEKFFESYAQDGSAPVYDCPYIDPLWDRERVMRVIANFRRRFV
jgi:hypothetical protein